MAVQRIDSKGTHGYQARWHVRPGQRVTRFFADGTSGGKRRARELAKQEEPRLRRRAMSLRRKEATHG